MSKSNIWYLPGPFHQYQEDVKALAKHHGLVIVDANATASREGEADDVPEVTLRPELSAAAVIVVHAGDDGQLQLLRDELASIGVIVESFAGQSLARPEGDLGDTAGRLFEVLEAVNSGITVLREDRDAKAEQVKDLISENTFLLNAKTDLQRQLQELKADGDDEEVAMKARLDAAGVTYRSNASKESLEKLIAELDKQ